MIWRSMPTPAACCSFPGCDCESPPPAGDICICSNSSTTVDISFTLNPNPNPIPAPVDIRIFLFVVIYLILIFKTLGKPSVFLLSPKSSSPSFLQFIALSSLFLFFPLLNFRKKTHINPDVSFNSGNYPI